MGLITGVVLAAAFAFVYGCSNKKDDDKYDDLKGNDEGGDIGADLDLEEADEDLLIDDEDAVDPRLREGFDHFSSRMNSYRSCSVNDLEIASGNLIVQCNPRSNSLYRATIPESPFTPHSKVETSYAGAAPEEFLIDGKLVGALPAQVVEAGAGLFVPFDAVAEDVTPLSGVAFASALGGVTSMLLDPVGEVVPRRLRSVSVAENAAGSLRLYVLGSDGAGENSPVLLSYPLEADGSLNPPTAHPAGDVIALPGKGAAAMEMVGSSSAMILNADADDPSVVFLNLGAEDPSSSAEEISLPEAVLSLPEIAMNGEHAVIPAVSGAILVYDIGGRAVAGQLAGAEQARSVAVEGKKAYVSYASDIHIIDISDPENPSLERVISQVGWDLGAISVKGGVVFVAATGLWWEEEGSSEECFVAGVERLCRSHVIAIDTAALQNP